MMQTATIVALAVVAYGLYCVRLGDVRHMTQWQAAASIAGLLAIPTAAILGIILVNA